MVNEHPILDLALERTRLANERTLLAYVRTGLTIVAAGFAIGQFVPGGVATWITAVVVMTLGGLTIVGGLLRFRAMRARLRRDDAEG